MISGLFPLFLHTQAKNFDMVAKKWIKMHLQQRQVQESPQTVQLMSV